MFKRASLGLSAPGLMRLYRAGVLIAFIVLLHDQSRWHETQRSSSISLRVAQRFFPAAHRVQLRDPERGLHYVLDARGDTLGCLLTTSPNTDDIKGYAGPNNVLIALGERGAVVGAELLTSGDTVEHVEEVKKSRGFWERIRGWKPSDGAPLQTLPVSGATLTSLAIAEAVQRRLVGAAPSLRFPEPLALSEVQQLFTNAARITPDRARWQVRDSREQLLGFVLRTSPQTDNVSGFRGPTECLVAVSPNGRTVVDVRIRRSYDTDSYVDQLRTDQSLLRSFIGRSIDELAALDLSREKIRAVSGVTQTSLAVAEGLKNRAMLEVAALRPVPRWRPAPRDWALGGVVAGAVFMAFTSLRGSRWLRLTWRLGLAGYVGLVSHDLLSLALFHGWAAHGIALQTVPGLALLAAAALLTPWATRRQLYCHQICPHGAAQQLLGGLLKRRWSVPARWASVLEAFPILFLGAALVAVVAGLPLNLATLEPFDAWAWRTAGSASIVIAVVGLVASLFIPQAYCRFGCPTGAIFNFVRASGSADHWSRRDATALVLLGLGITTALAARHWPRTEPEPEPTSWSGRAMGMAWNVKTFDEVADIAGTGRTLSNELAWVETMISHWRPDTDLSRFNASRETNAMPVPWPVLTLARWGAELSRETDGALDVTVGPLVRLWGFGPPPRRQELPTEAELTEVRSAMGWKKLEILDGLLRKLDPRVEVDLSSLAEGWAIDHVTRVLQRRGLTNLLVTIGGEMRASGRWSIAMEYPTRALVLQDEAIGTSGTYREIRAAPPGRNVPSAAPRAISHLIDPRTGRPVTHRTVSVSVRHPEALRADGWATALAVMGVEEAWPLAERLKLAAQFVVEEPDGKVSVRSTPAWSARTVPAPLPDVPKPIR